jgi:predicted PurR-regulated permease PerM
MAWPKEPPGTSEIAMAHVDNKTRFDNVLFYGIILLLLLLVFRIFEPFLEPLGWAGVLVVVFYSPHKMLERKFHRGKAAAISTIGVTLILILPVLGLIFLSIREGVDATHSIEHGIAAGQFGWFGRAGSWLLSKIPAAHRPDLGALVQQGATKVGGFLASEVGAIFRNVVLFLFALFVTLFALFYFFRDADAILAGFKGILPFEESRREKILRQARDLIFASVTTSLIIGALHGLVGGLTFAIVGLPAPIFWAIVMAFLSLLPMVGSWPVWLTAAIWLFSTGHWGRGAFVLLLCGAVAGLTDSFLRPHLIGGRSSLNGLLVFIGVLGGIACFGMLGIVLGPIVVATAASLLSGYSGAREQTG